MEQQADRQEPEGERHFAGSMTLYLIGYLRSHTSPVTLDAVLRQAGETRPVDELLDERTWSSYGEFRRLLEAAGAVLGGAAGLSSAGGHAFSQMSTPEYTEVLQSLGSPSALFANIGLAGASLSTVTTIEGKEVGPNDWEFRQWFTGGYAPFKEYCWFSSGLLAVAPRVFGCPEAEVVEEACECDGAPACVFRVRWEEGDDPSHRAGYLELRTQVLEARLEALQDTVADLVSGNDLEEVLRRIVASAARAVPAPSYVLALDALPSAEQRVYAAGLSEDEASAVADELLRGDRHSDSTRLIVEVASSGHSYGRLAALEPGDGRFFPQELAILEAYGRLAAAALDAAAALEEARRQASTAKVLLELSTSLSEIVSTEQMAIRLARAVPAVVDCDRAAIVLREPDGTTARVVASFGFPPAIERHLQKLVIETRLPGDGAAMFKFFDGDSPAATASTRAIMADTGTVAAATVPIVANGEPIGWMAALVTERRERLREDSTLAERLRGLAGQAATAIRNARLLDQIRHQALHDGLTGLPNRAVILDRAEHALARSRREGEPVAALFLDLDDFKDINDTLGHDAGDRLLQAVAARLSGAVRDSDSVGRLGGDEFVVLAQGASLDDGPEVIADRLHDALRAPFLVDAMADVPLVVSASIGIAAGDRASASDLLRDADIALYRAKAAGKNCTITFEPRMQAEAVDRLALEMELRTALAAHQFRLTFEPVVDLQSGSVCGVEVLPAWEHPTRGVLRAADFMPLLEETGMSVELGRWVLFEACRQAAEWQREEQDLSVSVNISARQLHTGALVDDVRAALAASRLAPETLVIEVAEPALLRDRDATLRRLRVLKGLGVRIAIDAFGTGYSSLAYLEEFPVDALKVERSFLDGGDDRVPSALVRTVVELGHALGVRTLAEGVRGSGLLQ